MFTVKHTHYLHTIRFRILLITISVIIFISAVITVISYFLVSNSLRENLLQTSETRLAMLCSSIDSNINGVKSVVNSCRNSSRIRKFLMNGDTGSNLEKREAREFITEAYASNSSLSSHMIRLIIMGDWDSDIVQVVQSIYSSTGVSSNEIYSLPYYDVLSSNLGNIAVGIQKDPFLKTKTVQMLPLLQSVPHPYNAGEVGYIFAELSLSAVTQPIADYFTEMDSTILFRVRDEWYLYQEGGLTLYAPRYSQIENLSHLALDADTIIERGIDPDNGGSWLILTRPLHTQGLYMVECIDERSLQKDIYRSFSLIVLIVLLAAAAIGILLSWFLNRTINVPVKLLQKRMERISGGDFSRDPSTEWDHELGDIGKNINKLSASVLALMEQQINDERQKREYEYKMLQSQINPHFMYNTLNSIKWMATAQNAPGIAEMTTALARLLKNISKGSSTLISLEEELETIKDYFTIQKYRYGGIITLNLEVQDQELLQCPILRFTLQPIVENAIFHGIEPKGSAGTVSIHVWQAEEHKVQVDVTDDGVGMEPEAVRQLLNNETFTKSSFFKEIGISNVHKRLQYEFGEEYGLRIQSQPGQYTTVSILLPCPGQSGKA